MKHLHTLLSIAFLCSFYCCLQGQYTVSGMVLDQETEESIPYVNIGVIEQSIGTVSDTEGNFSFEISDDDAMITLSAIGYETQEIVFTKLEESGTVFMKPVDYKIDMVTISASKIEGKLKQLGVTNKNRGLSIGFGNAQLGNGVGAVIEIKKPTLIKTANFVLNHAKGDSMTFRVNILEYKDKKIGKPLLSENIVVKRKQEKGHMTVDLSHLQLVLESNVLLSLEWISDDNGKGNEGITFDTKKAGKYRGIYTKTFSLDEYEVNDFNKKATPCFYFMGKTL